MKTRYFFGLGLLFTLFLACNKDEGDASCIKLQGTWQCQSWKDDGEEALAPDGLITSAQINFDTLDGDHGTYHWDINFLIAGSENILGTYTVNSDCNQVTLTPQDGGPVEYKFKFDGDILILDQTNNVAVTEIKFTKE